MNAALGITLMRSLYLTHSISVNGRSHFRGRRLFDQIQRNSSSAIVSHCVLRNRPTGLSLAGDVLTPEDFSKFGPDVVFVEGGLFVNNNGLWKIPRDMVEDYCQSGGVFIVADVDANEIQNHDASYSSALNLFGASLKRNSRDWPKFVLGKDDFRNLAGHSKTIRCLPEKMIISEWLRPTYEGVTEIIAGLPVCLAHWSELAASCNSDTTSFEGGQAPWSIDCCPFASVKELGAGFAGIITAGVSDDCWGTGSTGNIVWIHNLLTFLHKESSKNSKRFRSSFRSEHNLFLSHRSIDKSKVREIAGAIEGVGLKVWFDETDILPSQSIVDEISDGLNSMSHFLLFWSSSCVGAPWVNRELSVAVKKLLDSQVPLFVISFDSTPVPTIIDDIKRIDASETSAHQLAQIIRDAIQRLQRE